MSAGFTAEQAERIAWLCDWYYAAGYADGYARADAEELAALVAAIGGPDAPNWRAAVDRHQRQQRRLERRARANDPEVLAQLERERQRTAEENRRHDARCIREATAPTVVRRAA